MSGRGAFPDSVPPFSRRFPALAFYAATSSGSSRFFQSR